MIAQKILTLLESERNEKKALPMSAYMKNQFLFLGVSAPIRKAVVKSEIAALKKEKKVDWQFIFDCWQSPYREMQYVALEYLNAQKKYLQPADILHIKKLVLDKSWWDTVDALDRVVGDTALAYPQLNDLLLEWSVADNIWLRRVAINHQLKRKKATNLPLLETILTNNMQEKEFFIRKAIGWALREYSKTDATWVRQFIEKNRLTLSALTIREASKYL